MQIANIVTLRKKRLLKLIYAMLEDARKKWTTPSSRLSIPVYTPVSIQYLNFNANSTFIA